MNRTVFISSVIIACSLMAQAREWSYNDCVEWAKEHNISLRQTMLNEQTAMVAEEEAKAAWQPSLDFATTHGFSNAPWGEGNKNSYTSNYGLNARWTVWNGGVRENNIKKSELQLAINKLNTANKLRTIEVDMLGVYINLLYAKEAISIYEEAVTLSKAQADRARQLMEAGRLSRVDYSQLESQYEQDRYALVNAVATYDTRRMELKKLLELGINDSISVKNIDWTRDEVLALLPSMDESYRMATAVDLPLQINDLEIEDADVDVKVAKAGRMPDISLTAGVGTGYYAPGESFGTQMKRGVNESVGLTFSIPILDNKKTKSAVAKANIQRLNAQLEREARETELAQQVESWYIDLQSAQSRYIAGEQQVSSTELSNELVNEQFNLGLVNTVELMTAHNNMLEARHSLLQAKYMAMLGHKMIEYYRTSNINMP